MAREKHTPVGYDDTPMLRGQAWRVHDKNRPAPRAVTPGASAGDAPSDAVVLFGGTDLSMWQSRDGGAPTWTVEKGYVEVNPRTGNIQTKDEFGSVQLHLEFACPADVRGSSQGRGNSGVFLMGKYEVQVLDGYDNPTYSDGTTGAIYGQFPPLVNATRPPGDWQVYDIVFEAPEYTGDALEKPAYLTVFLNGVVLHNRKEAMGPTGHRNASSYDTPHGPLGPLMLQDHGDPVRYRNIWIRPLGDYD